jgi:hypothetical protein
MPPARLFPVKVAGKYGYIRPDTTLAIKPQFDSASDFHEGLAIVANLDPKRRDFRKGVIDPKGNIIAPLQYDQLGEYYADGRIPFSDGKKYGYLDAKGAVVIAPTFDGAWSFSEGVATVDIGKNSAVIDRAGNILFEKKTRVIGECHEGLMVCETARRFSYLDPTGATVFEVTCTAADRFSEGLASVLIKGKIGYIDKTGKMAIPPQFAQAANFHEGLAAVEIIPPGKRDFSQPQQFGYVNRKGALQIPATFPYAVDFSEGLAAIATKNHNAHGYIDKTGEIVIKPFRCETAGAFKGGLAYIQGSNEKIGYINTKGDFVWPLQK